MRGRVPCSQTGPGLRPGRSSLRGSEQCEAAWLLGQRLLGPRPGPEPARRMARPSRPLTHAGQMDAIIHGRPEYRPGPSQAVSWRHGADPPWPGVGISAPRPSCFPTRRAPARRAAPPMPGRGSRGRKNDSRRLAAQRLRPAGPGPPAPARGAPREPARFGQLSRLRQLVRRPAPWQLEACGFRDAGPCRVAFSRRRPLRVFSLNDAGRAQVGAGARRAGPGSAASLPARLLQGRPA